MAVVSKGKEICPGGGGIMDEGSKQPMAESGRRRWVRFSLMSTAAHNISDGAGEAIKQKPTYTHFPDS